MKRSERRKEKIKEDKACLDLLWSVSLFFVVIKTTKYLKHSYLKTNKFLNLKIYNYDTNETSVYTDNRIDNVGKVNSESGLLGNSMEILKIEKN